MDFFGIGLGEILVIATIVLVVVGPERLPEMGAALGRLAGELRRASQEFTSEINREIGELPTPKSPPPGSSGSSATPKNPEDR